MQILNAFKFFENETQSKESNILYNADGSILVLQISGDATDFSISVYGKVNFETDDYVALSTTNIVTFDMNTEITEKGIYQISIEGISSIYLEINETDDKITAFGKVGA